MLERHPRPRLKRTSCKTRLTPGYVPSQANRVRPTVVRVDIDNLTSNPLTFHFTRATLSFSARQTDHDISQFCVPKGQSRSRDILQDT